jgi:acyl-CoA thioester hydrolase
VYYEDTDFFSFVYHASYLRFLERGRTELLRSLGIHQSAIHAGQVAAIFGLVVRAMRIDFQTRTHGRSRCRRDKSNARRRRLG